MWIVSATCHGRSRSLTEHQGGALQGGSAHDSFVQDDQEAYGNLAEVHDGHAHPTNLHPDPPLDNGLLLQAINLCLNWDSNRAWLVVHENYSMPSTQVLFGIKHASSLSATPCKWRKQQMARKD